MCQRNLSRHDVVGTASEECCNGGTVMRCPERPLPHESSTRIPFPGDRIYLAGLQGFFQCHRWKNAGHGLGQWTFPWSGRTDENSIVLCNYSIFIIFAQNSKTWLKFRNITLVVCSKVNFPHFRLEKGTTWTGSAKVYNSFDISYFLNIFWVSRIRYDLPVMLTR